ncbi:ABC transporter substrate-binding protein [Gordonia shandongensis]|uniref:ABC transporter substrate-binding protein n=1 Tax=Gordonia shandongensis TaxID=376351 RepID=UPI00041E132B|nr:ABC transporter substrate-binding protein [Gordonia shandongensis]
MLPSSPSRRGSPAASLLRRGVVVITAAAAVAALSACGSQDDTLRTPDGSVISTTVTRINEVDIVNPGRDFSRTCLAETAPDPGAADVRRIVVTDPALLDALCALGLGPRVTAVTADRGAVPEYLGPQLTAVPTIGDQPDAAAVRTAAPELVLSSPATADRAAALTDTGALRSARTVAIDVADDWEATFREVAAATHRTAAADQRLDEFHTEAARVGRTLDAAHSQVSLVRFTPDAEMIEGTDAFGARIMELVGVNRPAAQRRPDAVPATDDNFTDADGDLIYVSYDGDGGRERGADVLLSDRWLDMGAPTWRRVQSVDDAVWYRASGLAAAWLVLNDLKVSLNGGSSG